MEVELRAEFLDASFENRERSDVHFDVGARGSLMSCCQNRIRLPAFRVREEQDFLGSNASLAAVVHRLSGRGEQFEAKSLREAEG